MMISQMISRGLLPAALFCSTSYVAMQIVFHRHMYQSGTGLQLREYCDAQIGAEGYPLRLAYTGFHNFDITMCRYVTLFHALLDPTYRPLVAELMTGLAAVTMIPFVEAAREQRPIFLRIPAVVGVLFQYFSFAVVMPLYYLAFILSGAATRSPEKGSRTKITRENAEALLFALVVGFIIPTIGMIALQDANVTAIWQNYPIIMALAQVAYRAIRPSRYSESGYTTIQVMYGFIFVASALLHIYYVWPLFFDIKQFKRILVPTLALSRRPLSLPAGVATVIQWDSVFAIGSTLLATFWFARNVKEIGLLLFWHAVTFVVFGPGAAIVGVLSFREARFNVASANC